MAGQSRLLVLTLLIAMATSIIGSGCGGPASVPLIPVRGRITLDGQPLPRGSVSFRADQEASNFHQPTGTVEKPGEYVVYTNGRPGAPAGSYRVIVIASESITIEDGTAHPEMPKSIVPIRYNQLDETPLRLTVDESSSASGYDLELKSHAG